MVRLIIIAAVLFIFGGGGAATTAHAMPRALHTHGADDGRVIAVAKKKHVPRYPRPRPGDRNLGPVEGRNSGNAFAEGVAQVLGAGVGGGGSGTCAVDYTTPNPTGCRVSRYSGHTAEPAYRPQRQRSKPAKTAKGRSTYTCFDGANRRYTSKTYKLGCYFADFDKPGSRPADGLKGIK